MAINMMRRGMVRPGTPPWRQLTYLSYYVAVVVLLLLQWDTAQNAFLTWTTSASLSFSLPAVFQNSSTPAATTRTTRKTMTTTTMSNEKQQLPSRTTDTRARNVARTTTTTTTITPTAKKPPQTIKKHTRWIFGDPGSPDGIVGNNSDDDDSGAGGRSNSRVWRIAHVTSPYAIASSSSSSLFHPLDQIQNITLESWIRAREQVTASAASKIQVSFYCAVLPQDQHAIPSTTTAVATTTATTTPLFQTILLNRSTATEYPGLSPRIPYPFLQDILQETVQQADKDINGGFDYLIYSNVDIALSQNFYRHVVNAIETYELDAFTVNRKIIPRSSFVVISPSASTTLDKEDGTTTMTTTNTTTTVATGPTEEEDPQLFRHPNQGTILMGNNAHDMEILEQLLATPGKTIDHIGMDCFMFSRQVIKSLHVGNFFLGQPPWGMTVHDILDKFLAYRYYNFKSSIYGTFHLGNDGSWQKKKKKKKEVIVGTVPTTTRNTTSGSTAGVVVVASTKNRRLDDSEMETRLRYDDKSVDVMADGKSNTTEVSTTTWTNHHPTDRSVIHNRQHPHSRRLQTNSGGKDSTRTNDVITYGDNKVMTSSIQSIINDCPRRPQNVQVWRDHFLQNTVNCGRLLSSSVAMTTTTIVTSATTATDNGVSSSSGGSTYPIVLDDTRNMPHPRWFQKGSIAYHIPAFVLPGAEEFYINVASVKHQNANYTGTLQRQQQKEQKRMNR
jgi:hypothetical protein